MKRAVNISPDPGRCQSSMKRARRPGSTSPAVRSSSSSVPVLLHHWFATSCSR